MAAKTYSPSSRSGFKWDLLIQRLISWVLFFHLPALQTHRIYQNEHFSTSSLTWEEGGRLRQKNKKNKTTVYTLLSKGTAANPHQYKPERSNNNSDVVLMPFFCEREGKKRKGDERTSVSLWNKTGKNVTFVWKLQRHKHGLMQRLSDKNDKRFYKFVGQCKHRYVAAQSHHRGAVQAT